MKFFNIGQSRICGRSQGLRQNTQTPAAATVCSSLFPFSIRFLSDQFEFAGTGMQEANNMDLGFKLNYVQSADGCTTGATMTTTG